MLVNEAVPNWSLYMLSVTDIQEQSLLSACPWFAADCVLERCLCCRGLLSVQEEEPANIVEEVLQRRKRSRKKEGNGDVDGEVMQLISMVGLTPLAVGHRWRHHMA